MSAANLYQLLPLLLHWLFDLKVLHPERPNATSGSRAFGPNPLHLVRQFRGRNFAAFVHIGKTLGKLRNFLSWVIDGRHLPALNPLIVGLETTSRRGLLCTGPIHQFTGLRCLSSHWCSSGACEVEVWKWSYWKRLKDQVHFRLLNLLFRS